MAQTNFSRLPSFPTEKNVPFFQDSKISNPSVVKKSVKAMTCTTFSEPKPNNFKPTKNFNTSRTLTLRFQFSQQSPFVRSLLCRSHFSTFILLSLFNILTLRLTPITYISLPSSDALPEENHSIRHIQRWLVF